MRGPDRTQLNFDEAKYASTHLHGLSVFGLGCVPEQLVRHMEPIWVQFLDNRGCRLVIIGERGGIRPVRGA